MTTYENKVRNSTDGSALTGITFEGDFRVKVNNMEWDYLINDPITVYVTVKDHNLDTFQFEIVLESAPFRNVTIPDQTTTAGNPNIVYDASFAFKEGSGTVLTYVITADPIYTLPLISFNGTHFDISAATKYESNVTITATNNNGYSGRQIIEVDITNTAPGMLGPVASITEYENITFTHTVDMANVFTESDPNQSLTFSITNKPTWLTESQAGDIFTISANASYSEVGDHDVTFRASDSYDYIEHNLTITIDPNDAPVASTGLTRTILSFEGKNESTTFSAFTDPENDAETYSMTNDDGTPINTTWITFDPSLPFTTSAGVLNYLPTASHGTPQTFKLIARDNYNPEVSEDITFNINYVPKDNPAVVSRTRVFIAMQHTTVQISKNIITDDDTIVSYVLTFANGTAAPSWINMTIWTASTSGDFEFDGIYPTYDNNLIEFTISATDSHGLIGTANFFIQATCKYKYIIL
jgi:hypothetical protein